MNDKDSYRLFCENNYVPLYSKPWWMDAICGEDHWDAKVFAIDGNVMGAMSYYHELRGEYNYITKAALTQSNGLIFSYPDTINPSSIPSFEEKVINQVCEYIESLQVDVYEQQYPITFRNWSPFFWKGYEAITRYTYTFTSDELSDLDAIWNGMDKKKRKEILKGEKNCEISINTLDKEGFYSEVEKVYAKQSINVPFTFELWSRLYDAVMEHNAGHILCAKDRNGTVLSTKFLVWDEKTMYALISGGDVRYQPLETKSALDWFAIKDAASRKLNYDFEGSMIERIAKAYRRFGAIPKPYFRIRKVFNPEIIKEEAEMKIHMLAKE